MGVSAKAAGVLRGSVLVFVPRPFPTHRRGTKNKHRFAPACPPHALRRPTLYHTIYHKTNARQIQILGFTIHSQTKEIHKIVLKNSFTLLQ